MRFIVQSRSEAEGTKPPPNASCISIKCTGDTDAELPDGYRSTLRLEFDDLDFDRHIQNVRPDAPSLADYTPFTPEIATRIWSWFREQEAAGVGTVVVHCWAGVSRSPAVALGLLCGKEQVADDQMAARWPQAWSGCYNRFVHRLIGEAA